MDVGAIDRWIEEVCQRVGRCVTNVIFLIIVGFQYLKIKISKNHLSMVLLFLGDLKEESPGSRS